MARHDHRPGSGTTAAPIPVLPDYAGGCIANVAPALLAATSGPAELAPVPDWLPVEDAGARRALDVARRDRLAGKDLSSALGFKPHYLVVSLSAPRDGHSYKTVRAILPRS